LNDLAHFRGTGRQNHNAVSKKNGLIDIMRDKHGGEAVPGPKV
jgi:hypothetical protein